MIEAIVSIIEKLTALGFSPLNIALIVMLYFVGAHGGIFPKFWDNSTTEDEEEQDNLSIRNMASQMTRLEAYFNHETTARLDKIISGQEKVVEGIKEMATQHRIWNEAGIKVKDCDTHKK